MSKNRARWVVVVIVAVGLGSHAAVGRELSMQARIEAHAAIERVYWLHRDWPSQNLQPKPAFETTMPAAAIRAQVEAELARATALEQRWQRTIGREEIQDELNRIASESRDPAVLAELFRALHDDPTLIAEMLVRPILVDRALRGAYARDPVIHAAVRRRASRTLVEATSIEQLRDAGAVWSESDDVPAETRAVTGAIGSLDESDDAFFVQAVVAQESERKLVTASWPKRPFDLWWTEQRDRYHDEDPPPSIETGVVLPAITAADCAKETWSSVKGFVAAQRREHTAVWTGSEMIVWGGKGPDSRFRDDGGRYVLATDSWQAMDMSGAPLPRIQHTAVWTGTEMVIWGGWGYGGLQAGGGRYIPSSNSWFSISAVNAPATRVSHSAVWTGTQMIVWGGSTCLGSCTVYFDSGGRYSPATDSWSATSLSGAPSARRGHVAVWTGSRMIVWHGANGTVNFATGGRYDPATDSWSPTSTVNAPDPASSIVAVWSGSVMAVWGGGPSNTRIGGRYDPVTDIWLPVSMTGAPVYRTGATGVWTGSQLIVWGGRAWNDFPMLNDGGRYNPSLDSWTSLSTTGAPSARALHTAIWTGSRMIVWGGSTAGDDQHAVFTGGRYDPVNDTWIPTATNEPAPVARSSAAAVWTGAEMIVWGGASVGLFPGVMYNTGGRYNPALDTWSTTNTFGAPSVRAYHTGVWTGDRVLIWGGGDFSGAVFGTGGAYFPSTDSWTTLPAANAPEARSKHTAVWTGTEMIIWGGRRFDVMRLSTGARYNPGSNTWTPTSDPGAGWARYKHSAVWDGHRMLVWGGDGNSPFPTFVICFGNRYDPVTDTWTTITSTGRPPSCSGHTAVWTGQEMLVWGGVYDDSNRDSSIGGRYDPAADVWAPMTATDAPSPRQGHSAVWTGSDMVVWGGPLQFSTDTGGRYRPTTDTWVRTSRVGAMPSRTDSHTAVWTGSEMIVWGGAHTPGSGSRYCTCAGEVCNGFDDDCDGTIDNAATPAAMASLTVAPATGGKTQLTWVAVPNASQYDVIRGDLGALRSSAGDFALATQTCVASHVSVPPVLDTGTPAVGGGFWYLVRGNNCGGNGTYGDGSASQAGLRDAEILASGHDCP